MIEQMGVTQQLQAGQYIYINCPAVSKKEWHPFTLSSAPEDPYLSCHIRCSKHLDWCYPFRQLLNPNDASIIRYDKGQTPYGTKEQSKSPRSKSGGKRRSSSPGKRTSKGGSKVQPVRAVSKDKTNDIRNDIYIKIDGPYGSASEEVFEYQSLILVGAGIGVTPFASIMRSMVLRRKQQRAVSNGGAPLPKTHFFWLCRSRFEFDAFKDLMRNEISNSSDMARSFEFHLYMSGETNISDSKFQTELKDYGRWAQLFTGRPKWARIFQEIRQENLGKEIGVFLCGPPPIAADLKKCSAKYSDDRVAKRKEGLDDGTYFIFHQENF